MCNYNARCTGLEGEGQGGNCLQDGTQGSPPPGTPALLESSQCYMWVGLCDPWKVAEVMVCGF